MKEIKIFIPEETKIEIEKIISNNDKIIINIPKDDLDKMFGRKG